MYFAEFQSVLLRGMWCVFGIFTAADSACLQWAASYAILWWV